MQPDTLYGITIVHTLQYTCTYNCKCMQTDTLYTGSLAHVVSAFTEWAVTTIPQYIHLCVSGDTYLHTQWQNMPCVIPLSH